MSLDPEQKQKDLWRLLEEDRVFSGLQVVAKEEKALEVTMFVPADSNLLL